MTRLPEFIRFNIPFLVLVLLLLAAAGLTFWHYRRTVPEISRFKKGLLMSLRFAVWALLLMLFFRPQLSLVFFKQKEIRTGVFVDRSLSVSPQEKQAEIQRILKAFPSASAVPLNWFTFNDRVQPASPDSLGQPSGSTNFSDLFKQINAARFDNVVLITDGYVTEGPLPQQLDLPETRLFTVGIGQNSTKPDWFIDDVQAAPTVYAHNSQQIRVRLGLNHIKKDTTATLRVWKNGTLFSVQKISLSPAVNGFRERTLKVDTGKPGMGNWLISLDTLNRETNTANNRRHFIQRILKKKVSVQIVAGVPGLDAKFLYERLNQNPDFEVSLLAERRDGSFIGSRSKRLRDTTDVLALIDFPGPFTTARTLKKVNNSPAGRLLFLSEKSRANALEQLRLGSAFNRFGRLAKSRLQSVFIPSHASVLQVFPSMDLTNRFWNTLPPVSSFFRVQQPQKGTHIWLNAAQTPCIVSVTKNQNKWILLNGSGFWRWHFGLQDQPQLQEGYTRLLQNMVRWLALRKKIRPVVLETDAMQAKAGQSLPLTVYLYDDAMNPLSGGKVEIEARFDHQTIRLNAIPADSSGRYTAAFIPPHAGTYRFTALGYRQNTLIGKDWRAIDVLPVEKEWLHSGQNKTYLKRLAKENHGFYVTADGVDSLTAVLRPSGKTEKVKRHIPVWQSVWLLTLLLLFISAEWILRKRFGLA